MPTGRYSLFYNFSYKHVWCYSLCSNLFEIFLKLKMPKPKQSLACRLRAYVREFGDNIFNTDGTVLYCKICNIIVSGEKNLMFLNMLNVMNI